MLKTLFLALVTVLFSATTALAHFGMVIPTQSTVDDQKNSSLSLLVAFAHPMEMQGMDMARPIEFGVFSDGAKTSLLDGLKQIKAMEHQAWEGSFSFKRPGLAQFYVIPEPYWEPAEDCFIQHIVKTVVPAFGEEEGWDKPLGLKAEIVPLTRPFANYAGNVFQGRVLFNGKPAPGVVVEVEYFNKDKACEAPNAYFTTQAVMTDANGVFTYAVPWAGWWGFAALSTSDEKKAHDGKDKDIELGAVLWTEFLSPKVKAGK